MKLSTILNVVNMSLVDCSSLANSSSQDHEIIPKMNENKIDKGECCKMNNRYNVNVCVIGDFVET